MAQDNVLIQDQDDIFLAVETDHKGRVHLVFTDDGEPTQALVAMTAFRSNTNPESFFVGVSDTMLDDDANRYESTFYVDAKRAAVFAQAFAVIAAKLS